MKLAIHKDGRMAVVLTEFWLDGQKFLTVENPDETRSTWAGCNCRTFEPAIIDPDDPERLIGRVVYRRNGKPIGSVAAVDIDNNLLTVYSSELVPRIFPTTDIFILVCQNVY